MDEYLDCGNLSTCGVVSGGTVSEGNCLVSVVDPGGVGSRRGGEGVERDEDNSEEGILVRGVHQPEEFLDVVHCLERMTSVAN